jgi:hypothetical protein
VPCYFFNAHIDGDIIPDQGGMELRDVIQALEVGRDTVQAMMQDPTNQVTLLSAALVVTNDAGEVVGEFPFADAFKLLPRPAQNER